MTLEHPLYPPPPRPPRRSFPVLHIFLLLIVGYLLSKFVNAILGPPVRAIGEAAVALGAGRISIEARIDPAVGFHVTANPGDEVVRGQPLATILVRDRKAGVRALRTLRAAIPIVTDKVEPERGSTA